MSGGVATVSRGARVHVCRGATSGRPDGDSVSTATAPAGTTVPVPPPAAQAATTSGASSRQRVSSRSLPCPPLIASSMAP